LSEQAESVASPIPIIHDDGTPIPYSLTLKMPVFTGLRANWRNQSLHMLSTTIEGVLLLGFWAVNSEQCGLWDWVEKYSQPQ
jgi:hypothetical protein